MKIWFLILLFLPQGLRANDIAHPFYLLDKGDVRLSFKTGLYSEEHEFEKAEIIQDQFEYKHWHHLVETLWGIHGKKQIGLNASVVSHGKLKKIYSPEVGLPGQTIKYLGLHALEIYLQEHFETNNAKDKLAIEIRVKSSPIRAKEKNNAYGGSDLILSFLYSHQHKSFRVYGDLQAEITGRKKIKQMDGETKIINTYSQFGNTLGLQWLNDKLWIDANALFFLTTDYNSKSPTYQRFTDKGFVVGGKILFGHYINNNSFVTLEHKRQGASFNIVTETPIESADFEIESNQTQLGVTWLF